MAKFGDVFMVINNAGIVQGKQFTELNDTLSSKQFVVNLECHFWIIKEFIGPMIEKNEGHIVSIASMAGYLGTPYLSDYCASKAGAIAMMEALRMELKRKGKFGVKCTTICPFFINTGMFQGTKGSIFFPFLEQEYVIKRMVSGILQDEEEVCLPWIQGFLVNVGRTLFPPSVTDRILQFFLGWDSMADFKGRQEKNAIFKTDEKKQN